jgi:hypothetical protein
MSIQQALKGGKTMLHVPVVLVVKIATLAYRNRELIAHGMRAFRDGKNKPEDVVEGTSNAPSPPTR